MVAVSTLEYWKRKFSNQLSPSEKRGTPEYFKLKSWTTLNQRTINGSHPAFTRRNSKYMSNKIRLEFTCDELSAWVDIKWEEIAEIYALGGTPSIDRKDRKGHYSIDNIQILELKENISKDHSKPVIATFPTGCEKWYPSARAAVLDGFDFKHISRAAIRHTNHKNCRWRFA